MPQAPTHVLIIPKRHFAGFKEAQTAHAEIIGRCHLAAAEIARQRKIEQGYRTVLNVGPGAGQSVFHLHVHLLGGRAAHAGLQDRTDVRTAFLSSHSVAHPGAAKSPTRGQRLLLHGRLRVFRRAMTTQQLRKVLRKRRPRQHHVTPHFVRLLLQIALHVRKESDDRRPLLQLALQLRNQGQRFHAVIVQIENDQ